MQRKWKACRYVRKARKSLRRLSGQTQKGYSEELPDDNGGFTDRGAPLRQYDPKLMRTRSRFEGVNTPRNEWNRRLRTKTSLKQTSRTSTSKRDGSICSHREKMVPRNKIGQTYNGFANRHYKQSRKQRGVRLLK